MGPPMPGEGGGDGANGECLARLTELLLIEQRGSDPRAAIPPGGSEVAGGTPLGPWLAPAAALAGGEPKKALALLDQPRPDDPSLSLLSQALRTAAIVMDGNWQPGTSPVDRQPGAQRAQFTAGAGIEDALASVADPGLRLCTHLAGRVIPVLLSSRTTLGHAVKAMAAKERTAAYGMRVDWDDHDLSAGLREPLAWFDGLYEEIAATRHEAAAACHLLLAADLRVRVGDVQAAQPLLRHGLRFASRSHATAGLAALLAGDWELGPPGTAEQCAIPATAPPARALSRAEHHYERADAEYGAAHSGRGRAAALLRLAHVQRLRGSLEEGRETACRARELAVAAGDGACAALLRIHQSLDLIQADPTPQGQAEAGTEAAEEVVAWATSVGSTSWLEGLRQLVLERAEFWSAQGDVVRARRAAHLAQRLLPGPGTGDSAATDPSAVAASHRQQRQPPPRPPFPATGIYLRARHRLASIVLTDLEQQDHLERVEGSTEKGEPLDLADCLGLIQTAKTLHDQASALRDPDVMAAARARIEVALRVGTDLLKDVEPLKDVFAVLASDLASCPAQETFFRSRRSRAAGLETEADRLARQALSETELIPDETFRSVLRCAAHVDLRQWARARAEMEAVEPRLSALQAAALWLRLGRPERAAAHEPFIDAALGGPDQDHLWERAAIRADLALARGHYGDAADLARQGLDAYEAHQVRLARDALRASFADDPVVAGLYHAAVLSTLGLGGPGAAATAFAQAERGRAGFLHALHALDTAGTDPAARRAVRGWLAAEVRWSAEFEDHAAGLGGRASLPDSGQPPILAPGGPVPAVSEQPVGGPVPAVSEQPMGGSLPVVSEQPAPGASPTPGRTAQARRDGRRARIAEAEQALDAAEAEVRRLVPAALTASGRGTLPDAATLSEALPPDTVLLTYHLYDDTLVGWAMTRRTLLSDRHTGWAHSVVAAVRRFHGWCAMADAGSHGEADGPELAELLLRPFAEPLRDHRRVLVVPPALLSLLPFHALPWDGDVLGARHEVSYLPSASLLTRLHGTQDRPWAELNALLVGDPAADPRHGLRKLPGTVAETAELARLLPRHHLLTGTDATRARVLEAAPDCQVLHLATHGLVDELAPNRSRLPLAGDDVLGIADLLRVAQEPQLLVLSACDTGRGTATAGGDVLGLTRAALITGARHAVVSLWPVRDRTGCLVITKTYQYLLEDPTAGVGAALARAQRAVRDLSGADRDEEFDALAHRAGTRPGPPSRARSWAAARDSEPLRPDAEDRHPYHWAPFIHVGV
ncbi:CHAT domain-containing protein [Streptomyces sp. NPDC093568]|uniref:CHAT domain-containing protein n=1 Tax=Streptomyces sp. NPDC093568 TaxID=3366041 RepID=UPI0038258390